MPALVVVALAGFAASLVDGSLGMGFGLTSATFLLAAGLSPAAISGTVNIAKVATGLASGAAHWRFGNVDRRLLVRLAVPGALGAIAGVTLLSQVDGDSLKPWLAVFLLGLGLRLLLKFSRISAPVASVAPRSQRGILAWAFAAGVTNGVIGAWGPVITPALIGRDDVEPRIAVGTANAAEVVVALTSVASVFTAMGGGGIDVGIVIAILVGGVIAAPLAAWLVRLLQPRLLGVAVGGFLLATNADLIFGDLAPVWRWLAFGVVLLLTVFAWFRPRLAGRRPALGAPAVDTTPAV